MPNIIEKPWGWSTEELRGHFCEVHRIDVVGGGFCSWHQHTRKDNVFSVAKGRLVIEYHNSHADIVQIVMQAGDTFVVPALTIHRFRAPFGSVRAFEVYYPTDGQLDLGVGDDIIRYSHGGRDANAGGQVN